MSLQNAESLLRDKGYSPTREIFVTRDDRTLVGLEISCVSIDIDGHVGKLKKLLPDFKIHFNPNTLTIYVEK